jgi:hypothetical protein
MPQWDSNPRSQCWSRRKQANIHESRDIAVDITTDNGLGRPRVPILSPGKHKKYSLLHIDQIVWFTLSPIQGVQGAHSPGVKSPGCEAGQ